MQRIIFIFGLFCFSLQISAQATKTTFEQVIALSEEQTFSINLPGQVEIQRWDGSEIKVEAVVTSSNGSTHILKHLHRSGRYEVVLFIENGHASLSQKAAKRQVIKNKGEVMDEQVSYIVYLPANYGAMGSTYSKFRK